MWEKMGCDHKVGGEKNYAVGHGKGNAHRYFSLGKSVCNLLSKKNLTGGKKGKDVENASEKILRRGRTGEG